MAQAQGQYDGHDYEVFWNAQEAVIYWGAVVSKGERVVGRPRGMLRLSAIGSDDEETAVRKIVEEAIDEGLDVDG